ncbi:hypothetical protein DRW07_13610 [Alteromonas sediminis]|uniref:STAS/SEC14 domain-containing protein n=1 Tax=Alteromonas sediminis TaxID=2259342 RepID=A0A3N5XZB8_9ALTE|nr:hypothetical protein [Alteromonas sediminis]RPJ65843.1 hypothetical protein DRW07_13610 [Alteromonas sediminis]
MQETAHGNFSIEVDGRLLINRYSEGFNIVGINALTSALLDAAKSLDKWVLLQLPEPSAGLTNDAIPVMLHAYNQLQKAGCVAVGLHDNSLFVRAGYTHKGITVTLPFLIDKEESKLRSWLMARLDD